MPKYKVLVLNQTGKKLDFSEDTAYWKEFTPKKFGVGLEIEYVYQVSDLIFSMKTGSSTNAGTVYKVDDKSILDQIRKITKEGTYDEVIFVYVPPIVGDIRSNTPYATVYPKTALVTLEYKSKKLWEAVNHERFHALERRLWYKNIFINDVMDIFNGVPYYKDSNIYATDGNRAETLKLFKPFWEAMFASQGYKYFRPEEIVGLKSDLVLMLDKARGIAGVPFIISSGFRTKEKNESVGGVEDSAHTQGLAVDLKCPDSSSRWKIINAALQVGFKRVGVGENFIHLDCDPSKPQNVMWTYYK